MQGKWKIFSLFRRFSTILLKRRYIFIHIMNPFNQILPHSFQLQEMREGRSPASLQFLIPPFLFA